MITTCDPNLNETNFCETIPWQTEPFSTSVSENNLLELSNLEPFRNVSLIGSEILDEPVLPQDYYTNEGLFDTDLDLNENFEILTKKEEKECSSKLENKKEPKNEKKFNIWKCKYNCGKIFTKEKYMNSHILVMHENLKKLTCKICRANLSTELRLKNHMLRHSNIKHLICLVCLKNRSKELSCMRHHLLKKHNIGIKHSLFQEAFYQMSLKEIAMEKRNETKTKKGPEKNVLKPKKFIKELRNKLKEKAKAFQIKLEFENEKQIQDTDYSKKLPIPIKCLWNRKNLTSKIVTAENGMQLIKLSNGQFRKVTGILVY